MILRLNPSIQPWITHGHLYTHMCVRLNQQSTGGRHLCHTLLAQIFVWLTKKIFVWSAVRAHAHAAARVRPSVPHPFANIPRIKRSNGIFLRGIDGERLPRLQRHLDCRFWRGVSLQARDWQHVWSFCCGSDERWYYGHRSRPEKNLVHLLPLFFCAEMAQSLTRWPIPGGSPMTWHKQDSKYHAFYVLKVTPK